ncbi:pre-toxin TG domain-containing protein [Bacillus paralicheniformis]|jgi:hypothetical protein|uniref:pre-toxin TG domain-containing protein n=1 Tax=Bacillus TaxID=1386 RepID=UPI00034236BF|nr:pre-toxin TG domain-containing protein [Bacillus paralicheniformis]AGN36647.1 hypothetical protein BaLi_c22980 [Bacillus paralicheniformis ATCC 9945a]MDI0244835.1 pre-toxin TG domain-containing protein [Bacillus paralicheniformis]MEC2140664.1 pre-toxin TG domain-containing protein [Bacillus paralicheniformis]MEC2328106.1 pre-toxin TG domain-containing protein [Bacillus paralicheniformis]MED0700521.1 pre-toxin TG domain-containing protein [Bacillus paralicheniformis]
MKSKQKEFTQKTGRSCEREWYEKVLDAGSTFAGNITGYYDYKKATEGVNPVTGETCLLHIMTSKNSPLSHLDRQLPKIYLSCWRNDSVC